MAEKIVIELEVDSKSGRATVAGLEKSVNQASEATGKATSQLDMMTAQLDKVSGGAVSTFKNFVAGAKSGVKSMGALRLAISATGIGLLVTAAAALVEYFTNFEKPLRIVDAALNAIGGAINAIVESFDKLLSGDITGFFTDVADGAIKAVEATNALYDAEERIFELQKATIVQNAQLRASVEENLKIAADTTLSLEERLKAQNMVNESAEMLIQNERELAAAELDRLKAELAIENNYKARRDLEIQVEQTTANLINIEAALNRQRLDAAKSEREIIAQDQALKDAALKQEQERAAEYQRIRTESLLAIDTALMTANEKEISDTRNKFNRLIELARQYGRDTVELERIRNEELAKLDPANIEGSDPFARIQSELEMERMLLQGKDQLLAESRLKNAQADDAASKASIELAKAENQAKLSIAAQLSASVANLLGTQTAEGKAAAVASAIISTYQGINAALAQTTDITPTQTLRFANAAAVALTGFASVKNILSTKIPGGVGGGSAPTGGFSPRPPSIGSSIGLINPTDQGDNIGNSISQNLTRQPLKAYVVSEDVISGIDLENKVRASGQFG